MRPSDTMLSLDLGPNDCLYRIRRIFGEVSKVVYVTITNPDIIPEERRTYGPSVVAELSKLNEWNYHWTTLTVYKNCGKIWCKTDGFSPHALQKQQILGEYPRYNILDLPILHSVKDRVSRVQLGQKACFLKIARFPHELGWLAQEIKVYHTLTECGSCLAPRLLGYAFEERYERVTGFLCESVDGRVSSISDLDSCSKALRRLHELDIIHGDITKYNIYITSEGPKFIDFEDSILGSDEKSKSFDLAKLKNDEIKSLEGKLLDESGEGRPWGLEPVP
jgi:hypothetical protein